MGSCDVNTPLLSEDKALDISKPPHTLHQIQIESVQRSPERTAIVSRHQPRNPFSPLLGSAPDRDEKDYLHWSYRQLNFASKAPASHLTQGEIIKGDAIVAVVDSCAEWFLGRCRTGLPLRPYQYAIVSRANGIQHILSALERTGALVARDEAMVKLLWVSASSEIGGSSLK
ncbi:MAG: hypothetical protein L6R38_005881 [Xanthoria sp. 2 TBL-2021]|nr:MAG: hypothetical protein L6R38_005881 [Xanthoria sp. 2 TBL-2021]